MRYIPLISTIFILSCSSAPADVNINLLSQSVDHAPQRAKLIATAKGEGKYIILHADKNTLCNTIYIEQSSTSKVKEYIIESLQNNNWHKIHEGSNPAQTIVLRFEPCYFDKLRLQIKRSSKIPRINSFSLYYDYTNL